MATPVSAETVSAGLGVTATVVESCALAVSPVAFGAVSPDEAREANGGINVTCSSGTGSR